MLKNLVTLVTGGASGLGRATVYRFAKKGSAVVFCDLPTKKGDEVSKEIGENVQFIPADITSETDIRNVINEISEKHGKLDVVVNCAGKARLFLPYDDHVTQLKINEDFQKMFMTHVYGTFNVIRLSAELMVKNEANHDQLRGVIVNTSGVEAFKGKSGQTACAASAGAIHSMTKALAWDLGGYGIRVVSIAPGRMNTPETSYILNEVRASISEECVSFPNRFGDLDEFAHLVQFIVLNPSVNATTIELSGGLQTNV